MHVRHFELDVQGRLCKLAKWQYSQNARNVFDEGILS